MSATTHPDAPRRWEATASRLKTQARRWFAVLASAAVAATGAIAVSQPAVAEEVVPEGGTVLLDEDFSSGTLPADWNAVLGDWQVVDGRLQASTGAERARIGFGPTAPEHFLFESTVQFVSVTDPTRWLNIGVDHHAMEDRGAAIVARSATTASNGLELAQAANSGSYASSPVGPSPVNLGVGQDHTMSIEVHGNDIALSIDGELALVGDNLNRTGGAFSFVINNSTVQFDNVRITELPAPPPMPVAPSVPQKLRLSEADGTATVIWDAPADAGAAADGTAATIGGYEVSLADIGAAVDTVEWVPATGTSHTFTALVADTEQVIRVRAVNSEGATGPVASVRPAYGVPTVDGYKLRLDNGPWPAGHVQGIAVDQENGFIYYSFTTMLVKTDLVGNVVGTVVGITGHLGDIEFNPADGRVYGSLEYKAAEAFYIAIFDASRIDAMDMPAQESDMVTAVYLSDVVADYSADMDGDGVFDGNTGNTADHRYGNSGIDGTSFGPKFGQTDGKQYLTVAAGIYSNTSRTDNDHQVLWQYDTDTWGEFEKPLVESDPHRDGPVHDGKYFVHTGNTTYGLQNVEYDPVLQRWWFPVYTGQKPEFPNYAMFAVDAATQPERGEIVGTGDEGMLLALADDGLLHEPTGIRGWNINGSVGFEALGDGLYYIARTTNTGGEGAILTLHEWTGDAETPFVPAQVRAECATGPAVEGAALDEQFCGDALPEGFRVHSGHWTVSDGVMHGFGERNSASRITFGQALQDYRLDARVRFDALHNSTAWIAFALDIPADGSEPWQHAGMRAGTSDSNASEFAARNVGGSYTVQGNYIREATPMGEWVDVSFVVRGTSGQWWYNGELVGSTTALKRSVTGVQGMLSDGVNISIDRLTVTELEPLPVAASCAPSGDDIRKSGQPGYPVGHRGTMVGAPENTIAAFDYAINSGAEWIEIDILWTKDEEIVVLHDDTVDRTHEGTGAIREMTLAEFKALDIKGHPGMKSPTLEEVLAWMKETGANVTIEYKGTFPLHLAQKTAGLIREYGVVDQSAALSFDLTSIERMRQVMPELRRHINLSSIPADPVAFAQQYGAVSLTWPGGRPPADVLADLHAAGVKVNSGTTDNPDVWEATAALGVDAITVNDTAAYIAWLADYTERNNLVECGTVTTGEVVGGAVVADQVGTVLAGDPVQLTAQAAAGYEFSGWDVTPAEVVVSADGTFEMPEGDVGVSAEFSPVVYAIEYNLGGGVAEGNPTTYTVESADIGLVSPTREGYTFRGWAGTGFEGISEHVKITSGSIGDRNFAAVWNYVPAPTPTVTATVTVEPTSTPTVTATATTTATATPAPGRDLYETPGFHEVNDRRWMTVCEPYSGTTRCWTYIWGTQVHQSGDIVSQVNGWAFNNLTYVGSPRSLWADNPLAETGSWVSEDGRNWRTECDTPATGGNGCRTWVSADVLERDGEGFRWVNKEVFNNMVRFG